MRAIRFRRLLKPVRGRHVVALRLRVNADPGADRAALLSVVRCDIAASRLQFAWYSEGCGSLGRVAAGAEKLLVATTSRGCLA
jgi:hypothetical protein